MKDGFNTNDDSWKAGLATTLVLVLLVAVVVYTLWVLSGLN